ncbi:MULTISPECIES: hypothetical protein [unclassified Endozoicomonas]|uniref:hypothetical protein n=1 Tax=unclassified Endozoicomonas TaxID=2644528 RepID=UPI002148434A|nr:MULTISPECIES: hypothetical protein [unclassified Endozoicomonas]
MNAHDLISQLFIISDPRQAWKVDHKLISSAELTAEQLGKASREHWHTENKLHWKLDVAMKEDQSRILRNDGAQISGACRT